MEKLKLLVLLLVFASQLSTAQEYDTLTWDGRERYYLVHQPSNYDNIKPVPLVIALHGGFGSGSQLEGQSQLSVKADQEGFMVVYPDGFKNILGIRTWNGGQCCGSSVTNNIDDVGFINTLIDTLTKHYSIDQEMIFATGMSNGAFMSYRLACELSHRIKAIAPVSGSMNTSPCSPQNRVPVIHFHSYQDGSIPYNGGVGSGVSDHYNPPLDSVFEAWSVHNGCKGADTIVNNGQYLHTKWSNCTCGTKNELYITHDGGHSWHGGQETGTGDPVSTHINANDLMWDFFGENTVCWNGIKEPEQDLKIYPNPSNNRFNLTFKSSGKKVIYVFDFLGNRLFEEATSSSYRELDLSNQAPGVYIVKVKEGEITSTKRITLVK